MVQADGYASRGTIYNGTTVMKTDYKYIHFDKKFNLAKTTVWSCINNSGGYELGEVKWNTGWRQYTYYPLTEAVYSSRCLKDIADFIEQTRGRKKSTAMNIQGIIDVLDRAKQEHYSEYEGLHSCWTFTGGECDCGADEINAEIDELILELQQELDSATKAQQ